MKTILGITLTEALGNLVFFFSLALAAGLMLYNRQNYIDLSLPFGNSIPYAIVVMGGGILYFSSEGIFGLSRALALAIFLAAVTQQVIPALKNAK